MKTDQSTKKEEVPFSIRGRVTFAFFMMFALVLVVGVWAARAELDGAVIAPGMIVIDQNVKKVQHRDGGIIAKINVSNGDKVQAGEVMIVLAKTEIKAELGIIKNQLIELTARSARLRAEIAAKPMVNFPDSIKKAGPEAEDIIKAELRLFNDTSAHLKGKKEQLTLQIGQLEEEVIGIEAEHKAKNEQIKLIGLELEKIQHLYDKKLTSVTRLYALQREEQRLKGELGSLSARIARTKHRISETKLQMISLEEETRLEAQRERRTVEARLAELREKETAANDMLRRTKLLAPQSGIVHELTVHTIGGVITPAETVLKIVPDKDRLIVEAQIAPQDIDQVMIGRTARLLFSAFNQSTTPELQGQVIQVAADVTNDERSGLPFYKARLVIEKGERLKLGERSIIPGMPVETFISTGSRTALSYFAKPITDRFRRAFRED